MVRCGGLSATRNTDYRSSEYLSATSTDVVCMSAMSTDLMRVPVYSEYRTGEYMSAVSTDLVSTYLLCLQLQ